MFEPWNGIWTEELLRDLCGGVTRDKGEFRAMVLSRNRRHSTNQFSPPFKVKREGGSSYSVGFDGWSTREEAVKQLNRCGAVPVNDNGEPWRIRPDELPDGVCPECKGVGQFECEKCYGEGSQECDLGHDHDCEDCDATGVVKCKCALQAASRLQLNAKV